MKERPGRPRLLVGNVLTALNLVLTGSFALAMALLWTEMWSPHGYVMAVVVWGLLFLATPVGCFALLCPSGRRGRNLHGNLLCVTVIGAQWAYLLLRPLTY